MYQPHVLEFSHRRSQGLQRTYKVTLNVTQLSCGAFAYESWVHHEGSFKGNGIVFPLAAGDLDSAISEARARIETDVEQLNGVSE
ncbi:hypothetical protein AWB76_07542 [Caballeronia temeraria]|uniref:Uncharacterized protein n=2 Tax=Caballeronia temeraria TaxID=1777137 RepID=A0A158DV58_9BURK|nr:hypothetical protein [Caballeronia temeraria]SAK98502.1 hypothetical protein AWB76_07542 [Caballeronia temeraria]